MDAGIVWTAADGAMSSFGQVHFGQCVFGDKRLTDRAVITGNAFMRHPGGTLPAKLPKAELNAYYEFANNEKVNHDNVLAGHFQHTRKQMQECEGTLLFIHDSTEGDFSGLDIADLGQIGNGHCRGLLIHNVLAMDYQKREALGLVGQIVQVRRKVNKKESVKASREHPQRESRLWPKGVEAVGRPPEGAVWVNLMDRGGDIFQLIDLFLPILAASLHVVYMIFQSFGFGRPLLIFRFPIVATAAQEPYLHPMRGLVFLLIAILAHRIHAKLLWKKILFQSATNQRPQRKQKPSANVKVFISLGLG